MFVWSKFTSAWSNVQVEGAAPMVRIRVPERVDECDHARAASGSVPSEEIVKGYEYAKGQWITLRNEDCDRRRGLGGSYPGCPVGMAEALLSDCASDDGK